MSAAPSLYQVEMEEWLAAHVEDTGFLLYDSGPAAQLGQQAGEVVEQFWRAIGHVVSS